MNSATHVGKSGKIRKQPAHVHSGMNTIMEEDEDDEENEDGVY
jgi:hypothetical protein